MKESSVKTGRSTALGVLMKYGIPLIISVGLCWMLFTGFDFREMAQIVRDQCDFRWIAAMLAVTVLSHVVRAMRWGIQLRAIGVRPPLWALVLSIFGTYAVNLVFPRLGEIWRTSYIARRQDAPFSEVFGSMIADRLADTVTVALITLATFAMASGTLTDYFARTTTPLGGIMALLRSPWTWVAVAVFAIVAWLFLRKRTAAKGTLRRFARGLWDGFAAIATMPGKGRWLLLTVALWGCYFVQMWLSLYAFPFTAGLLHAHGIAVALVAFVLGSLSMGVPSNGGIGPWQWAVIFALGIYGLAAPQAAAFANLVMACNTLLLIALGIITFATIALERRKDSKTENTEIQHKSHSTTNE